jgi:hypothetical protein
MVRVMYIKWGIDFEVGARGRVVVGILGSIEGCGLGGVIVL